MKIDSSNPRHWFLLMLQGLYTVFAICARYFRRRPPKPLVMLYGHQLSGNLKALYQYGMRHHPDEVDLYFLSLDPDYSAQLRRMGVRVLQCNRLLDMLRLSQAAALISDHGLHLMTPLVRFTDIVFIDVWHGIPFKGFVADDFKLQHRYAEVWVSSPLLKRIYEEEFGFEATRVHSLGYARTDRLFNRDLSGNTFRKDAGIPDGHKVVLYAPTWQHDDAGRELFPFAQPEQAFIGALAEVCASGSATLVIRSHLNAHISRKAYGNVLYCSQKDFPDTEDLLLATDVLICDWSSIAFDYLALDRPTIFLDVPPPFTHGLTLGKEYRFGKIVGNVPSLVDILTRTLEHPGDYLREQASLHQKITCELYEPALAGEAASRQFARLQGLVKTP